MKYYDEDKLASIERTWLISHWIPQAEFKNKAADDVAYLIRVIHELRFENAELKHRVNF